MSACSVVGWPTRELLPFVAETIGAWRPIGVLGERAKVPFEMDARAPPVRVASTT